MKKITSLVLAFVMCLSLCVTTFATEQPNPAEAISEEDLGAPIYVDDYGDSSAVKVYAHVYYHAILKDGPYTQTGDAKLRVNADGTLFD